MLHGNTSPAVTFATRQGGYGRASVATRRSLHRDASGLLRDTITAGPTGN
jgi:hypothetical protein